MFYAQTEQVAKTYNNFWDLLKFISYLATIINVHIRPQIIKNNWILIQNFLLNKIKSNEERNNSCNLAVTLWRQFHAIF